MNWVAIIVFVVLFGVVTIVGFLAARWRRADLNVLHEWGLAGRRLGTVISWFLLGGDLYTAYTFVAVPALVFGAGAIGFFAVPYTIVVYPLVFLILPRLWSVAHRHNYITASDFILGRYGNRWLALAVAVTGIIATMPYIALQLVGLQVVIGAMGIGTDTLIYITVIAMVIVIPIELGGYGKLFSAIPPNKLLLAPPTGNSLGLYSAYATLALGSAFALFLYPHSVTGVLSANSRHVIRRNAAYLNAYSLMLGFLAITGFMALAMGIDKMPEFAAQFAQYKANFAVPALILHAFPDWFVGVAFAAIGIGALVPAAIMSIAAANLYTRNIHREFINKNPTDKQESHVAKLTSLIVKVGALVFILFVPTQYAVQLQLLGGIWIIQTLPPVMLGAYTRWFNSWALLVGWAVGTFAGTWMAIAVKLTNTYPLHIGSYTIPGYSAMYSVILNLAVAAILTPVFNAMGTSKTRVDQTVAADYQAS